MEKYREIGLKLTPQRLAILHYLEGNKDHPSAESVYRAVHKKFPTMSLATVYSTLSALKEKGSLLELTIDPDKKRFDPETRLHNHLICISCRRIVDIHGEYQLNLPDNANHNFAIIGSQVEFYGFCPGCSSKQTTPDKEASYVRRS